MYLAPFVTTSGRACRSVILVVVVLASVLTGSAGAAEGDLDRTFAGDGRLALPAAGSFVPRAVSVDRTDRVVVAGYRCEPAPPFDDGTCLAGGDANFRLTRLMPNGGLDAEFGDTGFVTTQLGEGRSQALDVLALPDGRIVAAGLARVGGRDVFGLARYTARGALDAGFGTGGMALIPVGSAYASIADVEPGPGGTLLVAGQAVDARGVPRIAVARLTARGDLDARFGTGGIVLTGTSGYGYGLGLVTTDAGPVVAGIAGDSSAAGTFRFAQVRLRPSGASAAVTERRVGRTSSFANGLEVLPGGGLLAAGAGTVADGRQAMATVLTLGNGGTRARQHALGDGAVANDVVPEPRSGGAWLIGQVLRGGSYAFAALRVDAGGALRRTTEIPWSAFPVARATAGALQRSGRLVTVGLGCAGGTGVRCSGGTPVLLATRQLAAPPSARPAVRVARRVSRRRLRRGLRVEVRLRRAARIVVSLRARGRLVRRIRPATARRRFVLRLRARARRGPLRLVVSAGERTVTRRLRLRR